MPSQAHHLHQLTMNTSLSGLPRLLPLAFIHQSCLNQPTQFRVLTYSQTILPPESCVEILGTYVRLSTLSATRSSTGRTGLISEVNYQHSDGALHLYELVVVSPDWLLTQSVHTRNFTQQSTLDIVTTVLEPYHFEWRLSETLNASELIHSPLAFRTQADVSDWEFVMGLLADIGVSAVWIVSESQDRGSQDRGSQDGNETVDTLGYWMLINQLDELNLQPLRYAYAHASVQSGQDTVRELQPISQQLGSQTVVIRADGLAADCVYEGHAFDESSLSIEGSTTLIATPSRATSEADADRLAQQYVMANGCHRDYCQASGSMRGLVSGSPVVITDLPYIGSVEAYCLAAQVIGIEPASDSVSYHHQTQIRDWLVERGAPQQSCEVARNTGVWVTAQLLDSALPYCPYPSSLACAQASYHGLTQARTGEQANPSYASTVSESGLHEVVTTPVWSGANDSASDATPALRSLQLSSGATHGWQFAPRLGQSVLLSHWYGDVDSPVICRSLYDGIGMGDVDEHDVTHQEGGQSHRYNLQGGASPRWHGGAMGASEIEGDDTHAGWVSGISQFGLTNTSETALLFDDTPNKLGMQWSVNTGSRANAESPTVAAKSVFAPSEHLLELGVMRHRFGNHQSSDSGAGFRAASDHGLQVLGAEGVLLSTFGIRHSQAEHESAWVNDPGQRQLNLSHELSNTLTEAKQVHLQSQQKVDKQLRAFEKTSQIIDEKLNTEVLGAPDVLLVSRDSVLASGGHTLWSAKTIIRQSGGTQSDSVAGNYQLLADKIESLSGVGGQAAKSGFHVSANREVLAVQAQGGELQLNAQQSMTIGSESGKVHLTSPTRIKLQTSGGASITIDSSGVKLVCPGTIKVKAVKKRLVSGARANYGLPMMPETIPLYSNKLDVYDLFYQYDFSEIEFKILRPDGQLIEGVLDEHGRTAPVISDIEEEVEILVGFKDADWGVDFEPDGNEDSDEEDSDMSNQYLEQNSYQENDDD